MEQNVTWPVASSGNSRGGQIRVALAGLLVLGALAYLVFASMPQGTVYYQTVKEVRQNAFDPKPVRVAGAVVADSIKKSAIGATVSFEITDGTSVASGRDSSGTGGTGGANRLAVAYHGVVPDIFGPNIGVVVEGQRDANGVFQAQTLLAKCPSKFQNAVPTPGGAGSR